MAGNESRAGEAAVFISYASADRDRVLPVADRLAAAGVSVWLDRNRIEGGRWAEEIVRGIDGCKVLVLMCSDASMRSWAVKQEVQLAGEGRKAFLPLLLAPSNFPEQMRFFLAGWQWIELLDRPPEVWLPTVLRALQLAGVNGAAGEGPPAPAGTQPQHLSRTLEGLRKTSLFSEQIWPVPLQGTTRGHRPALRDLGAPQEDAQHVYRLGDRIGVAIESDRDGHLLLLNEGMTGKWYCLCPSRFAPATRLLKGCNYLPQAQAPHDAFVITGNPGTEHLLAILTEEPLGLEWMPTQPRVPARVLAPDDLEMLLGRLRQLPGDRWTALATDFEVVR